MKLLEHRDALVPLEKAAVHHVWTIAFYAVLKNFVIEQTGGSLQLREQLATEFSQSTLCKLLTAWHLTAKLIQNVRWNMNLDRLWHTVTNDKSF